MSLVEELSYLESQLSTLIFKYEQYFTGLEKRPPLKLFSEVEQMVRKYANTPMGNTELKHKFTMLLARLNTYRERWNRILRLIEDGKYSRDKFNADLRSGKGDNGRNEKKVPADQDAGDLDRLFNEFREARKNCQLPFESLTKEMVAATLEKSKPALAAKLGTDNISFRIVVENGKPKIKAASRK